MRGAEADRLEQAREGIPWKRWGPYLSERQWGTVREDYSDNGDAWSYFSHDQARSAPTSGARTGSPGSATIINACASASRCGTGDPILKERLFGFTNSEGNHGEDVKEYYFYLDATPTSSYLKYRYRYPLDESPMRDLVVTNRPAPARTGVRADRHRRPRRRSLCGCRRRVRQGRPRRRPCAHHRGQSQQPEATVHVLPSLWFRNTWWMGEPKGVFTAAKVPETGFAASTRSWVTSCCGARASPS